jgi:hypothetical protein
MSESELSRLHGEIQQLQQGYREQRWLLAGLIVIMVALLTWMTFGRSASVMASTPDKDGILHLRGLIIEDENKRERIRLGAPLPDPMIHGTRYKRSAAISGLIISDAEGNERGGYVTSDKFGEAFLSLDSEDEQQVLFLANPKGGVNLDIFDSTGNEAQLTVFTDGPKLKLKKMKRTVAELPPPAQ